MNRSEPIPTNDLLKGIFFARNRANSGYSLRAFARDLKVSHTYLSLVFNGKKRVHPKRAAAFAEVLKLDPAATAALKTAAQETFMNDLSHGSASSTPRKRCDFFEMELDRFRLLADWYHVAILDLTLLSHFRSSFSWIAGQLKITPAQAKSAVKRLVRLGLLEKTAAGWVKSNALLAVPATASVEAIRRFHRQMIVKAAEALGDDGAGFETRHIVGTTMAIDSSRLPAAKRRIERFRRRLTQFLCEGQPDRLYQLNVQVFPLDAGEKSVGKI